MRPSWILSEEERARRGQGKGGKGGEGQGKNIKVEEGQERPGLSPVGHSQESAMEMEEVRRWGEAAWVCLRGQEPLPLEMIAPLAASRSSPALANMLDIRTEACCRLLPQLTCLPPTTQARLVTHNLPLVTRLRQAVCLASHLPISALLSFVSPQQACQIPSGEYRDLWQAEERQLEQLQEVAAWLQLEDPMQLLLLVLLLLFCPDGLAPEDKVTAERIQLKYVLLLQVPPNTCPAPTCPSRTTWRLTCPLAWPPLGWRGPSCYLLSSGWLGTITDGIFFHENISVLIILCLAVFCFFFFLGKMEMKLLS